MRACVRAYICACARATCTHLRQAEQNVFASLVVFCVRVMRGCRIDVKCHALCVMAVQIIRRHPAATGCACAD
jgi:hypothetical protein